VPAPSQTPRRSGAPTRWANASEAKDPGPPVQLSANGVVAHPSQQKAWMGHPRLVWWKEIKIYGWAASASAGDPSGPLEKTRAFGMTPYRG